MNSPVNVAGVVERLDVSTANGPVTLRLEGSRVLNGKVETKAGPVTVRLGDDASTRLECRGGLGPLVVRREFADAVREGKNFRAVVGEGEGLLEIHSKLGPIVVK